MIGRWDDLNARARGLGTRLFPRGTLEELAQAQDLDAFRRQLDNLGVPMGDAREPAAIELALRRWSAATLRIFDRWLGERRVLLSVVLEAEDRQSLHALVRGAAASIRPEDRLGGLIPTPTLPERILEELARQPDPRRVAALLVSIGHFAGGVLLALSGPGHPDLLRMELALDRLYAERAVKRAAPGGAALRRFVQRRIDFTNASTALLLAGGHSEIDPGQAFLPGGHRVAAAVFAGAAQAPDRASAITALARVFPPSIAELVRQNGEDPGELGRSFRRWETAELAREALLEPLGPAPALSFLLRLRQQLDQLRSILWNLYLGAPAELRRDALAVMQ